jgi:hypothetical protein
MNIQVQQKKTLKMKSDFKSYLRKLLTDNREASREDLETFSRLIDLTLEYRDKLKARTGEILSIEETKMAINIYVVAQETGKLPSNLDSKTRPLIRLWLREIDGRDI